MFCDLLCSLRAVVKVTGQIDFSFPAGNVSQLESHEPLKFRLGNTSKIVKLLHNQNILTRYGTHNVNVCLHVHDD